MQDEKYNAKEKIVQQMSKDGLTKRNLVTGETENISSQEADIQFGTHEQNYELGRQSVRPARKPEPGHSRLMFKSYEQNFEAGKSRLRFSQKEIVDELPPPVDDTLGNDFYNTGKHFNARNTRSKLDFEKLGRSTYRAAFEYGGKLFGKIYQGVKGEYRKQQNGSISEETANDVQDAEETIISHAYSSYINHRTKGKKYKPSKIDKLQKKANITHLKSEMARVNLENFNNKIPSGGKVTGVKAWQKKRLQRKYAAKLRKSDKAAAKLEKASKKSANIVIRIWRKVIELLSSISSWLFALLGFGVFIFIVIALLIVLIIGLSFVFISTISYTAENQDIHDASVLTTQLEANLEKEIEDISTNPKWDYIDEFHYDIDPIGHDPFSLMAWLTTKYDDFKFSDVEPFLRELHNARYNLQYDVEVEIRERTYTDSDGHEHTEEYKYYILNVTLESKSIEEIIEPEMLLDTSNDLRDRYDTIMETKGGRQSVCNPFDVDWTTGSISSKYGYRLNPLGEDKEIQFHRGIDIPMPTGTPIRAGVTGKVIDTGFNEDFGNYIILEDKKGEVQVKYAHCDSLSLGTGAEVKGGETIIGCVGNTGNSTGNHLHIGVKENGQYVNPIYAIDWETKEEANF